MFEMTYSTADGRRVRGGMAFDSPVHAKRGVYVTPHGSRIVGKDWPKMKHAFDELPQSSRVPGDDQHRRGAGARDEADLEAFVSILRKAGLDEEVIREALEMIGVGIGDDERPENASRGGFGGKFSGASKDAPTGRYPGIAPVLDLSAEYGAGIQNTTRDVYGAPASERYDPAERLPGGGASRRLSNDAAICSDEEMAVLYSGIENVRAGY